MTPPLGDHEFERMLAAEIGSAQVNVYHGIPILGRCLDEGTKEGSTRTGNQDVQATKVLGGGADKRWICPSSPTSVGINSAVPPWQ